jgi:hypothetical protein
MRVKESPEILREEFSLKIIYKDPIEAGVFAEAISGIASLYKKTTGGAESSLSHDLCISRVREGSIEIDFAVLGPGLLATYESVKLIPKYLKYFKSAVDFFNKKSSYEISQKFESNDLGDFSKVMQLVAKDSDGQMVIGNNNIENLNLTVNINSGVARKAVIKLDEAKAYKKKPVANSAEKVAMYFKRTSDRVTRQRSGDRVVIESISSLPTKVEFSNTKIKTKILGIEENIFNKVFIVDVHIETVDGQPVLFKIQRLHEIENRPKVSQKATRRKR